VKVLVTGRGTSGSWQIRGEQLGKAIGATVMSQAVDVRGFDVVVLVKRALPTLADNAARAGVPLVWDVVDSWPQPVGNTWDRAQCMAWLRQQVREIRPSALVAATHAMAKDCEEFGLPVLRLSHHAWEGQGRCTIVPAVRKVGYQGGTGYLGWWRPFMQQECALRGWAWVENPASVAELDIVLAVREADGYAPRHWKSGVKLANAQGCGTPFIGNREAGYLENASGAELWADSAAEMVTALDALSPQASRARAAAALFEAAPRLESVAVAYRAWLERLPRA
jgi:hypothetical protein